MLRVQARGAGVGEPVAAGGPEGLGQLPRRLTGHCQLDGDGGGFLHPAGSPEKIIGISVVLISLVP